VGSAGFSRHNGPPTLVGTIERGLHSVRVLTHELSSGKDFDLPVAFAAVTNKALGHIRIAKNSPLNPAFSAIAPLPLIWENDRA
jgi:hypothetical protein